MVCFLFHWTFLCVYSDHGVFSLDINGYGLTCELLPISKCCAMCLTDCVKKRHDYNVLPLYLYCNYLHHKTVQYYTCCQYTSFFHFSNYCWYLCLCTWCYTLCKLFCVSSFWASLDIQYVHTILPSMCPMYSTEIKVGKWLLID